MSTQTFTARFEALDSIREFVAATAQQAGMNEKDVYSVQLAADEAASNIIEHAYAGITDGQVEITAGVSGDSFQIIMRDHGKRFYPEAVAEPDVNAALEERLVGGLGLFFMRKLMDEVRFEYSPAAGNVLTMRKHLSP